MIATLSVTTIVLAIALCVVGVNLARVMLGIMTGRRDNVD